MQTQSNAVRVDVDTTHLLKGLKQAFSNRTNVLLELLQNARRAGATTINVTMDDNQITVTDDGCGIADFQSLVRIGGSNWDEAIQSAEGPYGMGVLSCLYAAKQICIESQGTRLRAMTADLIAQQLVALEAIPSSPLTSVTLIDHTLDRTQVRLQNMVVGFPIPVTLNGVEIPQPMAIASGGFHETPLGWLRFDPQQGIEHSARLFLQGFEVSNTMFHSRHTNCSTILHLDSKQFQGRFPDREHLAEEKESLAKIEEGLKQLQREFLHRMHKELAPADFVEHYGEQCMTARCQELLTDCPYLPSKWVYRIGECDLKIAQEWEDGPDPFQAGEEAVPISVLQNGFCLDSVLDDASNGFCAALYAERKELPCVRSFFFSQLRADHPIKAWVTDLSHVGLVINREIGRKCTDVDGYGMDVVACTSFTLTHPTLGDIVIDDTAVSTGYERDVDEDVANDILIEGNLLVSPVVDPGVVRQVTCCIVDDQYDEDLEQNLKDEYRRAHASASGTKPAERLLILLNQTARWDIDADLRNRSFKVSVNRRGELSVREITKRSPRRSKKARHAK